MVMRRVKRSNQKRRGRQQKGGLKLNAPNMDQGPPFHPQWDSRNTTVRAFDREGYNSYRFLQEGGKKKKRANRNKKTLRRRSKTNKSKSVRRRRRR
jgi:hypothetical protein